MSTTVTALTESWQLVVADSVAKFTLQNTSSGNVFISFGASSPAADDTGLLVPPAHGVTRDFADGNVYARAHLSSAEVTVSQ